MSYTDTFITLPSTTGFTGPNVRALQYTISSNVVDVHTFVIQDPNTPTQLAGVTAAGNLSVDGSSVTQPVSGTVAVSNFPVSIIASLNAAAVYFGTTALTPQYAFANISSGTTDASLVALSAGNKIIVLAASMQCGSTATTATFNTKPSGAGQAISMTYQNGGNGGEILPFCPVGWFATQTSQGLTITTGSGSTTGVTVVYVIAP
jgi:hypothetical protein